MNVSVFSGLKSSGQEHPFYLRCQLLIWLLFSLLQFSLFPHKNNETNFLVEFLFWDALFFCLLFSATHYFLRPYYWWLSRTGWSCATKITVFLLAIHLSVWLIAGIEWLWFRNFPLLLEIMGGESWSVIILYHLFIIVWALGYHFWTWKSYQQEVPVVDTPMHYVICQCVGWLLVGFLWYLLYTGRGGSVVVNMDIFIPWILKTCCSGFLISHCCLRPYCRNIMNINLGGVGKIVLSLLMICICVMLGLLVSIVWRDWSGISLTERTGKENIAGFMISFLVFAFWVLVYSGWLNWRQRQDEETRRLQLEVSFRDAQLSGLKQQLNPHFIFNALNSLRALIVKDPKVARKMVTGISNLLRYSLYESEKDLVPLEQEVEIVKDYLAIELLRYEGRISLKWNIPEQLNSVKVIPLCLQTLVENAIKHCMNQYTDGIHIYISARSDENNIYLLVENRGRIVRNERSGIGLKNTQERLALLFGEHAALSLTQKEDEIVEAEIVIPLAKRLTDAMVSAGVKI